MPQPNTDRLREDFQRVMTDAETLLRDTTSRAGERLRETNEQATNYVRHRPWQSLGAALAMGALVGLFLGRKRR